MLIILSDPFLESLLSGFYTEKKEVAAHLGTEFFSQS